MELQNDRLCKLRKCLNLTQNQFGERLGVGNTAISKLEKGERGLTEQMAKAICREFNVDYLWLMTGEGSMFLEMDRDSEYAKYAEDLLTDTDSFTANFIKNFIVAYYSKFNDNSRKIFDDILREALEGFYNKDKVE